MFQMKSSVQASVFGANAASNAKVKFWAAGLHLQVHREDGQAPAWDGALEVQQAQRVPTSEYYQLLAGEHDDEKTELGETTEPEKLNPEQSEVGTAPSLVMPTLTGACWRCVLVYLFKHMMTHQ
jgi:hypothetical protein